MIILRQNRKKTSREWLFLSKSHGSPQNAIGCNQVQHRMRSRWSWELRLCAQLLLTAQQSTAWSLCVCACCNFQLGSSECHHLQKSALQRIISLQFFCFHLILLLIIILIIICYNIWGRSPLYFRVPSTTQYWSVLTTVCLGWGDPVHQVA